jgi:hypothetical protein
MALPIIVKRIITIIYTPLLLINFGQWLVATIYWKEQWECLNCRKDENASIYQQFLYLTIWNMYLTIAVFVPWAYFTPKKMNTDTIITTTMDGGGSGINSDGRSIINQNKITQLLFLCCTSIRLYRDFGLHLRVTN